MTDMRLIVAGAGGRMGRALTRIISETKGAVLAGALEAPGSELLGKDAGMLAGLPTEIVPPEDVEVIVPTVPVPPNVPPLTLTALPLCDPLTSKVPALTVVVPV